MPDSPTPVVSNPDGSYTMTKDVSAPFAGVDTNASAGGGSLNGQSQPQQGGQSQSGQQQTQADLLGGIKAQGQPTPITSPVPPHRSLAARILGSIADVLGGQGQYDVNPDTGEKQFDKYSRQQQVGNIISGAIRGLGASQAQNPLASQRGLGTGIESTFAQDQALQAERHKQQIEEGELAQNQQLTQARVALTNHQIAALDLDMKERNVKLSEEITASLNRMEEIVGSDPRNKDMGEYSDIFDLAKKAKAADPDFAQKMATGRIRILPSFDDTGKQTGIHAFEVNPAWADQLNAQPETIPVPSGVGQDGKPIYKAQTVPAGGMPNGKILDARIAGGLKAMQAETELAGHEIQAGAEVKSAGIHAVGEERAAQIGAQGKLTEAGVNQGMLTPTAGGGLGVNPAFQDTFTKPDVTGFQPQLPVGGAKEYTKTRDAFLKSKPYENLQSAVGAGRQFSQILDQMQNGNFNGAASIVGLFDAIGISSTPLAGRGFRINNDVINEHVNARGLSQRSLAFLLKLKKGDIITPQQLRDYSDIATAAIRDQAKQAVDNAHALGLSANFVLPPGNGQVADHTIMSLYDGASGGDPNKAIQMMQQNGWK